jgi:hypothetical protein
VARRVYQDELVTEGIVDLDFVKDVLAVDFTRPIYSPDRCGPLRFAPELDAPLATADRIKAGFVSKLSASSEVTSGSDVPGAALLANLRTAQDAPAHKSAADAFIAARAARPPKEVDRCDPQCVLH